MSRAVRNDGQVSLSAEKSFVTSAGSADGYVVSTLDADGSTPVASTIYLVLSGRPMNSETVARAKIHSMVSAARLLRQA